MIEVHEHIDVPAPADAVWAVLSQPEAVVPCMPGAALGDRHEDGSFDATLTVRFGPTRVTFRARTELQLDEASRKGTLTARGKDTLGGSRVTASASFLASEHGSGTAVDIDGSVEISGKLASLIEGGANVVVKRMAGEFAANLAAKCAG